MKNVVKAIYYMVYYDEIPIPETLMLIRLNIFYKKYFYLKYINKDNIDILSHIIKICGGEIIDYPTVEAYIRGIEDKYGVIVQAIGYDRWNALATAQRLEAGDGGEKGYNTIEVKQHSSILHPPTKLLREYILEGKFKYEANPLYEINFQNAKCTYDTNRNLFVNKKKSNGKVDMVVSTIIAVYLLQQDVVFNDSSFTVQVL